MQSKEELESWYQNPDPWGYETNPDDMKRKDIILSVITGKYDKALDIGAGEGWITKDLPAKELHALEISDNASSRLPENVKRVTEPEGSYDLVIATGVLYKQYDNQNLLELIKKHASKTILLCHIKDWEVDVSELGEPVLIHTFKYREYTEILRVYDRSIS